ncbi:MAG: methyl-accepting chemotaxis protein [Campylobacteraceae bacterium]|nr:methyl-accepting chemotaxis protein [Campylobacteraceae bacterium]
MFSTMSIRVKLFSLLLLTIVSLGLLSALMYVSTQDTKEFGQIESKIEKLQSDMLMLRRNEKDFILRKDLKYKQKFEKNINVLINDIRYLKKHLQSQNIENNKLTLFSKFVLEYKNDFYDFVKNQEEIGLHPKDALYGSLRASVHKIQDYAKKSKDYELLAKVYDLRKQEKDFMLRLDLKYVDKYSKKIDALSLEFTNNSELINNLYSYKEDFLSLVGAQQRIGLSSKLGVQGTMRKTIHKAETLLSTLAKEIKNTTSQKIENMIQFSLIISALLILILITFILLIIRSITSSLVSFQDGFLNFFKYINKESKHIELLEENSEDELGKMTKLLNKNILKTKQLMEEDEILIEEVKKVVSLVKDGKLLQEIKASTSNDSLDELKTSLNDMLETISNNVADDVNEIQKALEKFHNLDFSYRITSSKGAMVDSLNSLAETISEMLRQNKTTGLRLEISSNELLKNVKNLSKSSNEAAASLEETAAAIEDISSVMSDTTSDVSKMTSNANKLNTSVKEGEDFAKQTTLAMDDINKEVESINEAIGVIDQIAFQTNILSLNAAVEAATAGEAGKGFAVVAQEVRNLASRSAQAAKEIKDLVEHATTKANTGKEIANKMIAGYAGLNKNIENTLSLINKIETASSMQQNSIHQISNSINLLDKQTQENANVASITQDIALETQDIALVIVKNANEKEFTGKNSIQAREIPLKEETNDFLVIQNSKQVLQIEDKKAVNKNIAINSAKFIQDDSNDEWESF